jgi:hypothetical protein
MSAGAASWTPDPFATEFDRRDDGSLLLRPLGALERTPPRLIDFLEHWARAAPDRVLVARRDATGSWREVTYAEMLHRVQRVAGGLLARGLSADKPLLILSGNSIEHLTLGLAAIWSASPAISLRCSGSSSGSSSKPIIFRCVSMIAPSSATIDGM